MLAVITSELVVVAVVFGIPLVVATLVLVSVRTSVPRPVVLGVAGAAILVVAFAVWGVFRGGETSAASGATPAGLPAQPSGGPAATTPPPPSPTGPPCSPEGAVVMVTAQNTAFDTDCLAAPADTAFSLVFDNQDAGIPHNVAIFEDSSLSQRLGGATDAGDFITGPDQTTYEVSALAPGTYYFHCDLHPPQMNGTFVVA
jgi:plastocyanin